MRKLKFRCWYDCDKSMTYDTCPCKNESGILMQFTGLLDKSGKEIYEGDIVRAGKILSVIEYSSGQFIGIDWQYYFDRNLEVIGNIYENKELLS